MWTVFFIHSNDKNSYIHRFDFLEFMNYIDIVSSKKSLSLQYGKLLETYIYPHFSFDDSECCLFSEGC